MNPEFWQRRWETQQTHFHQSSINSDLINYFPELNIKLGESVLVPLCGKSRDMLWLEEQGYDVIGIELSERAILEFLSENNRDFNVSLDNEIKIFTSDHITLICGNIFTVPKRLYNHARAVYDRAALVALPTVLRQRYAELMCEIFAGNASLLLITLDRDRVNSNSPPFNVDEAMVRALYGVSQAKNKKCFSQIKRLVVHHKINNNKDINLSYQRNLVFAIR